MAAICWAMEGISWGLLLRNVLRNWANTSVRPFLWPLTELHSFMHSHVCVCVCVCAFKHTYYIYTYEGTYVCIHARADTYTHAYMRCNLVGISHRQNIPPPAVADQASVGFFFFLFSPMTHVIDMCYVTGLACILLYRLCIMLYTRK